MNDLATGKAFFQLFHQSCFEFVFEHCSTSKNEENGVFETHSILLIKEDVFIAVVFVKKCEFLWILDKEKAPAFFTQRQCSWMLISVKQFFGATVHRKAFIFSLAIIVLYRTRIAVIIICFRAVGSIQIVIWIAYLTAVAFPCFWSDMCKVLTTFAYGSFSMKLYKLIGAAIHTITFPISCPPFFKSHTKYLVESEALRSYTVVLWYIYEQAFSSSKIALAKKPFFSVNYYI